MQSVLPLAAVTTLLMVLLSRTHAAPSVGDSPAPDASHGEGATSDVDNDSEVDKRLSSFVRIGRPSSFVRIGRPTSFIRAGRPGNFVRIGRADLELDDAVPELAEEDGFNADKRASQFVRIGKASRFVRIGKSQYLIPDDKRMSSFVRIGKSSDDEGDEAAEEQDVSKRALSFVRIGKIPSSAFVRIGREDGLPAMDSVLGPFNRIARMGQSSFVRIGKRDTTRQIAASGRPADPIAAL